MAEVIIKVQRKILDSSGNELDSSNYQYTAEGSNRVTSSFTTELPKDLFTGISGQTYTSNSKCYRKAYVFFKKGDDTNSQRDTITDTSNVTIYHFTTSYTPMIWQLGTYSLDPDNVVIDNSEIESGIQTVYINNALYDRDDGSLTVTLYIKANSNITGNFNGEVQGDNRLVGYTETLPGDVWPWSKSGYTFNQWSNMSESTSVDVGGQFDCWLGSKDSPCSDNFYFKPKWVQIINPTITFSAGDGGSVNIQSATVASGSTYTVNNNEVIIGTYTCTATPNPGYKFSSWNVTTGQVAQNGDVVTASFTTVPYTATFDPDGGTWSDSTTANKTIGYNITGTLSAPAETVSKTGYNPGTWKCSVADGNWTINEQLGSSNKYGNVTFIMPWTGRSCTVTLNDNGGSGGSGMVTATYGSAMPAANKPTRTGYNFKGYFLLNGTTWGQQYYNSDMTNAHNWDVNSGTATLTAKWEAKKCTVIFNKGGGSGGTDSKTATYDQPMTAVTIPSLLGYTFSGYFDATSGGNQYYKSDGTSYQNWDKDTEDNTTLYAQWTPIKYFIKYNGTTGNDSTTSEIVEYTYNNFNTGWKNYPDVDNYRLLTWKYNNTTYKPGKEKNDNVTTTACDRGNPIEFTAYWEHLAGVYTCKGLDSNGKPKWVPATEKVKTGSTWVDISAANTKVVTGFNHNGTPVWTDVTQKKEKYGDH